MNGKDGVPGPPGERGPPVSNRHEIRIVIWDKK